MQCTSFIKRLMLTALSIVMLVSVTACGAKIEGANQKGTPPSGTTLVAASTPESSATLGSKWAMALGGSYTDDATHLLATSDGGVLVIGSTRSSGAGESDGLAIKLDANNKIQWAHAFGGPRDDSFNSAGQMSDGGFILAGSTQSFDEKMSDAWLVKIDREGNIVWQKTLGEKAVDYVFDLKITPNDEIVLVGTTQSYGERWQDIWASKVDSNGTIVWQKVYYTDYSEFGNALAVTQDNQAVLIGQGHGNDRDIYTIKINIDDGEIIWKKTYNLAGNQGSSSIIPTTDGGFLLAGSSFVSGGTTDGILMKINGDGNPIWGNIIGTPEDAEYFDSAVSTQNGYVIAGQTASFGKGGDDAWVIEVDEDGNIKQQLFFGDRDYDHLNSITVTNDGRIFATGSTLSFNSSAWDIVVLGLDKDLAMIGCNYCGDTFAFATSPEINPKDWEELKSDASDFAEAESTGIMTGVMSEIQMRVLWSQDENIAIAPAENATSIQSTATVQAFQAMSTATVQAYQTSRSQITATAQAYKSQAAAMTHKEIPDTWNSLLSEEFTDNRRNWSFGDKDNEYWIGNRRVSDGKYLWRIDKAKQDLVSWTLPGDSEILADFFVSVEIQISGSRDSCSGLRFRGDGENYYLFEICPSQYYRLSSHSEEDGWKTLIDWSRSDFIQSNDWNRLAIMAQGSHFEFYINDQSIDALDDDRWSTGNIAIAIDMNKVGAAATFEFDNLVVINP